MRPSPTTTIPAAVKPPAPKIAIVTCADPRLSSIEQMLGLAEGDVDMIRNFGTVIDDDAVRSLVLSTRLLGSREIMIINHTDCGMLRFTDSEFEDRLRKETGQVPIAPARFYSFTDAEANTKEQIQKARSHPWISPEVPVRGFVFDVNTGRLSEVFPDRETVPGQFGDGDMPSQAMQDVIDTFRDRQKASASQVPPTLEQRRATFAPAVRLHPVPDDVLVREVTAGGVPAHWLAAPGADTGRVLLFLHGGGFELGSLRSDGELAARLGRASGMRVLFPEYRLAPEHPFPAAIDDVLAAWRWLRTDQGLSATSLAVAGDSAGGGLAVALLVATRDAGDALPAAAALMSPTVGSDQLGGLDDRTRRSGSDLHPRHAPPVRRRLPGRGRPQDAPGLAAVRPTGRAPAAAHPGRHGRPAAQSHSERLAKAAARAGVDVTLEIGEGLPHVYQLLLGTPEAAQATEQIGKFLRARVR